MFLKTVLLLLACTIASGYFHPRRNGRIVGGHPVDISDYPHQLSLEIGGKHDCGGSIISKDWALTASHCVYQLTADKISFRSGTSIKGTGGSVHQATEIIRHPNYHHWDWDYALVKVAEPFRIGSVGVNTIKLAETEPAIGVLTTATGWGELVSHGPTPSQLQGVDVTIVNRFDCNNVYGNVTERMICAADPGRDACNGDSGGALMNKATRELVGIVSWGYECAYPGYPGVYSNAVLVRDWIRQTTGV